MNFGHKMKDINPLVGIVYIILCLAFGSAMYLLGKDITPYFIVEYILKAVFYIIGIGVWIIAVILINDLFKYFKSN